MLRRGRREAQRDRQREERVRDARVAPVEDHRAPVVHEDIAVMQVVVLQRVLDSERGQPAERIAQLGTEFAERSPLVRRDAVRTITRERRLVRDGFVETRDQRRRAMVRRPESEDLANVRRRRALHLRVPRQDLAPPAQELVA
jgi:hypothetical protein